MDHVESPPTNNYPDIPFALKVVATAFVIFGLLGLVDVAIAAMNGRLFLDFNVFCLLIGRGLRRLSRTARWWAVVFLGLWLLMVPIAIVIVCLIAWQKPYALTAFAFLLPYGWFGWWQLKTLRRDDIRRLLGDPVAGTYFPGAAGKTT